ncbi:MAG: hypothetical protein JW940_31920 [Polyangiaceae bacterium]|nr:hypothetical protein [Polyangiaceae bacterium]
MALVLGLLLLGYFLGNSVLTKAAIPVLVVTMTAPRLFYYVAVVWLGATRLLGAMVSRAVLTLIFVGVVTPLGLFMRTLGRDPLRLARWKRGTESVLVMRNHVFEAKDIENPY